MVSEISTCMDRTDPSLNSSHVDTHSREICSREKRVQTMLSWHTEKKRASVPPCQNHPPHLRFSSCTVGVTQNQSEKESWGFCCMIMVAGPLSDLFFPSFQQISLAYLRRPCEHVLCETPFRLIWDIITGPLSVAPVALNVWGRAHVCV